MKGIDLFEKHSDPVSPLKDNSQEDETKPIDPIVFDKTQEDETKLIDPIVFDKAQEDETKLIDPIVSYEEEKPQKAEKKLKSIVSDEESQSPKVKDSWWNEEQDLMDSFVEDNFFDENSPPEREISQPIEGNLITPRERATVGRAMDKSSEVISCVLEQEYQKAPVQPGNVFKGPNMFNFSSLSIVQPSTEERQSDSSQGSRRDQPPSQGPGIVLNRERPTQYDLAEKMKRKFILRTQRNCLYKFTGKYYQYLSPEKAYELIYETCEPEIAQVGNEHIIKSTYSLLLMDGKLSIPQQKPETGYAVFENGVLRLADGVLFKHTPDLFLTAKIRANYNPNNVYCPIFDGFLHSFSCEDELLMERILQMIGYCLVSDTSGKVFFVLQGPSGTGKSTLQDLFRLLFDLENITSLDFVDLQRDQHSSSDLVGKAICLFPDLADKPLDAVAVGTIKKLTGGDLMTANPKYLSRIKFYNTAKLIAAANGRILIQSPDDAFQKRIIAIPCRYQVPDDVQQKNLCEHFVDELDGIASKAVLAYLRLRANNYRFAGNYAVNEGIVSNWAGQESVGILVEEQVEQFLLKNYCSNPDEIVYIADAYKEFQKIQQNLTLNSFSQCFCKAAELQFGSKKERKRKPGAQNPQSCLRGICHREKENEKS